VIIKVRYDDNNIMENKRLSTYTSQEKPDPVEGFYSKYIYSDLVRLRCKSRSSRNNYNSKEHITQRVEKRINHLNGTEALHKNLPIEKKVFTEASNYGDMRDTCLYIKTKENCLYSNTNMEDSILPLKEISNKQLLKKILNKALQVIKILKEQVIILSSSKEDLSYLDYFIHTSDLNELSVFLDNMQSATIKENKKLLANKVKELAVQYRTDAKQLEETIIKLTSPLKAKEHSKYKTNRFTPYLHDKISNTYKTESTIKKKSSRHMNSIRTLRHTPQQDEIHNNYASPKKICHNPNVFKSSQPQPYNIERRAVRSNKDYKNLKGEPKAVNEDENLTDMETAVKDILGEFKDIKSELRNIGRAIK